MQKEVLKSQMIRDKQFLKELYEGSNSEHKKKIINFANDMKLNTLIKFLHFLANGEITIKKDNFEQIPNKTLKFIKKFVEKKAAVQRLLKSDRIKKLQFLRTLANFYQFMLYCLFNET